MKAVIYARYSSAAQKETSIEDQLRVCMQYAKSYDYTVISRYLDYEKTGTNDNRDEFQKMLSDSAAGLFDTILVYEFTRFARNRYESVLNKQLLKKNGVRVVSATEHIPDTPEGALMESLLEGMAEYYSQNLAKNTMRGRIGVALKCRHTGGRPLLGYTVLPDKTYAVDERAAGAVRLLFQRYADGASYVDIMEELNRKGYRTTTGNKFGKNSLHALLKNDRYIGVYTYNKRAAAVDGKRSNTKYKDESEIVRIEGGIPAIIDHSLWERVQIRMEQNKKAPARNKAKTPYLLTGKIYCGHCGGAMVGKSSTSKSGTYHYYSCCAKQRLRDCDKKNVRKEWIEQYVIDDIHAYLTQSNIETLADRAVEIQLQNNDVKLDIARMSSQLVETGKALSNIMTAIEQGIFTVATKDRIKELENDRASLIDAIGLAEMSTKTIYTKKDIVSWLSSYQAELNPQVLVNELLHAVFVYDDRLVLTYNYGENGNAQIDPNSIPQYEEGECGLLDHAESSAPSNTHIVCSPYILAIHVPIK